MPFNSRVNPKRKKTIKTEKCKYAPTRMTGTVFSDIYILMYSTCTFYTGYLEHHSRRLRKAHFVFGRYLRGPF